MVVHEALWVESAKLKVFVIHGRRLFLFKIYLFLD